MQKMKKKKKEKKSQYPALCLNTQGWLTTNIELTTT